MLPRLLLTRCLAVSVLGSLALAEVHVVELEGSTGLTTIQDAVDIASEGDTILVRERGFGSGGAAGFVVDAKSLTVIGVSTANHGREVDVQSVVVRNLASHQTVVLRNLMVWPRDKPMGSGLQVEDSAGSVRLESCELLGGYRQPLAPTVRLEGALDVSFFECEIRGPIEGDSGPAAVDASGSRVAFNSSTVTGGAGRWTASYTLAESGEGSLGMHLRNRSFAWIGRSTVQGGEGGFAECIHNSNCVARGGGGGDGLRVDPGSICVSSESEHLGGEGGSVSYSAQGGGEPGEPGVAIIGDVEIVPGGHRDLQTPVSASSDSSVPFVFSGLPGEHVTLFMGDLGGFRFLGPLRGALLVNGGSVGAPVSLGIVPSSGLLEVDVPMPLVSDDAARSVHVQALFATSPTRFRLSPPRLVSVMGDATPFIERPDVVRVSSGATAGGFGRTWQHAAQNLHDSLTSLPDGEAQTEVWLKRGTYTPAPESNPGARTPIPTHGSLSLLGGFAGTENAAEQRDPSVHPTTITGDLLADDRLPGGSTDENSAGLLTFRDIGASVACRISGLTFLGSNGGSAVRSGIDHLSVDRCSFFDNTTQSGGAGIFAESFRESRSLTVRDSRFHRNRGRHAGAISANTYSSHDFAGGHARIEGCEFIGNSASETRSVFALGDRVQYGGVFNATLLEVTLDIDSCTLLDNDEEAPSTAVCCFGGIFVGEGSAVTLENSVVWSHRITTGAELVYSLIDGAGPSSSRSNCVHWLPPSWNSFWNMSVDPRFQAAIGLDGLWASGDENVRLAAGSPCIDAGDSDLVPASLTLDLDGNVRFVDDPASPNVGSGGPRIVDIGAYERPAP
ncbi:MAG: choice-of-anchor Q domain-containing protein [Planctomycetota bacterium]